MKQEKVDKILCKAKVETFKVAVLITISEFDDSSK
jgi:hypothetical protein